MSKNVNKNFDKNFDPNNTYGRKTKKNPSKNPSAFAAIPLSSFKQDYINEALNESLPDMLPINSNKTILQPSPSSPSANSAHLKMSVRLPKGIVTSLTIKKNIIALWLLYTIDPDKLFTNVAEPNDPDDYVKEEILTPEQIKQDKDIISREITDFVYRCLDNWKKETGKGLSDFITEMMIADFMDEYELYEILLPLI